MSMVSPFFAPAGSQIGPAFANVPQFLPNAPFGSQADFFGLNRAPQQFQLARQATQQAGWANYNNLVGSGLNAAFGGAPVGPIQHLSNRLAASLYGGGDFNNASLLPNTNVQPWELATYGSGIGSIFDPIHRATPTGIGNFGMLNNNTANNFNGGFNPLLANNGLNNFNNNALGFNNPNIGLNNLGGFNNNLNGINGFNNNALGFNGFNPNSNGLWPAMYQSQNYIDPLQLRMGHNVNPFFGGAGYVNDAAMDYSAFLGLQVANQAFNPYTNPIYS